MCTGQQGSMERQNNSSKETHCVCERKLPPLCSRRGLRLCLGKRMGGIVVTVIWIIASLNMGFLDAKSVHGLFRFVKVKRWGLCELFYLTYRVYELSRFTKNIQKQSNCSAVQTVWHEDEWPVWRERGFSVARVKVIFWPRLLLRRIRSVGHLEQFCRKAAGSHRLAELKWVRFWKRYQKEDVQDLGGDSRANGKLGRQHVCECHPGSAWSGIRAEHMLHDVRLNEHRTCIYGHVTECYRTCMELKIWSY